jgi:predicted outer membrane repeat protein
VVNNFASNFGGAIAAEQLTNGTISMSQITSHLVGRDNVATYGALIGTLWNSLIISDSLVNNSIVQDVPIVMSFSFRDAFSQIAHSSGKCDVEFSIVESNPLEFFMVGSTHEIVIQQLEPYEVEIKLVYFQSFDKMPPANTTVFVKLSVSTGSFTKLFNVSVTLVKCVGHSL